MVIQNNSVVSIHYHLTDDSGNQLDSSAGRGPLKYIQGTKNIIAGLEKALTGKSVGDKFKVSVQPEDGYGVIDHDKIQELPRSAFAGVDEIEPGMQFHGEDSNGNVQNIIVMDVSDDKITIDANHPLAGKVLHFDISVEEIREATAEEISHGHVH